MARLAQFRAALRANPDALAALKPATRDRYRSGRFPHVIRWLLAHPDVLRALANDAEIAQETPPESLDTIKIDSIL